MTPKESAGQSSRAAKGAKKKTPENPRSLTLRQVKLVEGLAAGKSVRGAALDAGYSPHSANQPKDLLGTQSMRDAMAQLLAPIEKIASRINEGLDAERTEFAKYEGRITDRVLCVDLEERRKYCELAARLKGLMPGDELSLSGDLTTRVIIEFENVNAVTEP